MAEGSLGGTYPQQGLVNTWLPRGPQHSSVDVYPFSLLPLQTVRAYHLDWDCAAKSDHQNLCSLHSKTVFPSLSCSHMIKFCLGQWEMSRNICHSQDCPIHKFHHTPPCWSSSLAGGNGYNLWIPLESLMGQGIQQPGARRPHEG